MEGWFREGLGWWRAGGPSRDNAGAIRGLICYLFGGIIYRMKFLGHQVLLDRSV